MNKHFLMSLIALVVLAVGFNNCSKPTGTEVAQSETYVAPTIVGRLVSKIDDVSNEGTVFGYAMDADNKKSIIKVIFYGGGPAESGEYIGEVIAKDPRPGTYAGHYFFFKVPEKFANGKPQQLYAYAHEVKSENMVLPSPFTFASYTPKAELFYNQNVAPEIGASCTRCHTWNHRSLFYGPLLISTPLQGGSPTNNRLFRKISGIESHNGGSFCAGGINSGLCNSVQAWWRAEFQ